MKDDPRRPADAYFEMAELVGENYFRLPVPDRGKVLVVMGKDAIATEWWLTAAHGLEVSQAVQNHPYLRLVGQRRYPVG